jgi:hypothetical protein
VRFHLPSTSPLEENLSIRGVVINHLATGQRVVVDFGSGDTAACQGVRPGSRNLDPVSLDSASQAELYTQIALRHVAAPAAHFVCLDQSIGRIALLRTAVLATATGWAASFRMPDHKRLQALRQE